ncbi:protein mono-ADP-ribosyltransferase PARP14-like [Antedon mediterranea]|uniref:protein mono-ADP-ribosyltransferase PARP14-like n=1 Tax=Antedon mediterranea TaxID=105859 RepID=UPI003AF7BCCE
MIAEETLEMYFENTKRSGGGSIVSSKLSEDESKCIVTFENEQIVKRVLARNHKIQKCPLVVKRPNKKWKFKDSVDKSVLEVHGADENVDTELIQMYFESSKSGGNGSEIKAEYHEDRKVWKIRFSNSEVADSVLKKSHKLGKKDIKVLRPQLKRKIFINKSNAKKAKKLEEETIPLVVENVDESSISEDHLKLYFENKKKSCGGPIAFMQKVHSKWIIHFQKNGVAEAVVEQKYHEVSRTRLTVRLGVKQVKRPIKKNCLLITDLPKRLNDEMFDLYLEKVTSMNNPTVKFGKDPTKAMVTYADPINDIDKVIFKIKDEQLSGAVINANKVFDVDTIVVKNVDKSCTEEMLKLYFENSSRSGGGPILDTNLEKGTIQFADYKVVKSVCKRKHTLHKRDLEICLCYDEIGEVVSDGCQWTPDPVCVKDDPYLLTFASKKQEFMNELSAAGIQMEFIQASPDVVNLSVDAAFDIKNIHDWDDYATSTFKRLCDQFDIKWLNIGDECFEDFQPYVEKAEMEGVELQLHDSSPSLIIVGVRHIVKDVLCELSKQLDVMNEDIKRKKNIVERPEKFGDEKIKKIRLLDFEVTAKSKFGVDFVVDDDSSTVIFKGLPGDIDSASLYLYRDLENIVEVSFPCEAEISKFLLKFYDDVIRVEREDNHFPIEYIIEENRVKVYSTSLDHAKAARSSIKKMIKNQKYQLSTDKVKVMKLDEGKALLESFKALELVTVGISQVKGESCIMITGFDMVVSQVISKLDEFILTNQILEKKQAVDKGVVLLLENHHSQEISTLEKVLEAFSVKLTTKGDIGCIIIRGSRSGIDKATEEIIAFERKVQTGKHLISQPGMASYFKEEKGRRALKSVENMFKCIIEVDGKFTSSESMQVLLRHRLQRGVELTICKADMTEMNVDVIVNAANEQLQHVGGLAKAIVDAGGKEIQIESNKIIAARGRVVLSGEVVVTDAGKLPCKKVIHTVGPKYNPHQSNLKILLRKSVSGAYEEADKSRFNSIALSAISSGIYGYPLAPCTQEILEATKEYFKDNPRSTLQHVYFVSVDIKVCKAFESATKSVFKVMQDEEDDILMVEDYDDFVGLAAASAIPISSNSGLKISNDVVTTKEGFNIKLIKGKIEDSRVDIIVNTTSRDLNLNNGNVSNALLQAAGAQLQQECDVIRATTGNIPLHKFVETGPAALKCRKIFHTASQNYQGPTSMQNIKILLKTILSSASNMRSIAIPALGTGNLQYPADQVAKVMYEEAIDFSANYPQSNLKEIHFVVYYKDTRTIQAFDSEKNNLKYPAIEEEKKLKKPRQLEENSENRMYQVNWRQPVADHLATSSPYKHFRRLSPLQAEMDIGCVTVRIEQGDITACDADSIVNLTSSAFDLRAGAVSSAILKAGGRAIQTECTNNKKSRSEEVWTGSGSLSCGAICHLPMPNSLSQLKAMLVRIMATANNWKNDTMAFPAIGTGNIGHSPKEAATFLFDCILKFSKKENPGYLKKILIIVFEIPMTSEFISTMEAIQGQQPHHKGFLQRGFDYMMAKVRGTEEEATADASTSPQIALKILSLDEEGIKGAKSKIQSIIAEEMTQKILQKEIFSRFTPQQIAKLNKIAGKYEVDINARNIKSNTIELKGRPVNVMDAQQAIFDLTDKIHEAEKEEKEKQLILKDVKWFYTGVSNDMVEFDGDITVLLEKAYKNKEKYVTYTASNNHKYKVNLRDMEESDLTMKKTYLVFRNDLKAVLSLPSHWSPMKKNEQLKVEDLLQGSSQYKSVESKFTTALANQFQLQSIIKISRIQNIELWKQYAAKKETFEKTMPGKSVEQMLYHGTDEGSVDKIYNGGFNRSYAGKNAAAYGQGTYFAAIAGYSAQTQYSRPNARGEKHIFLCNVLVGNCGKGQGGLLAPPQGFHSVGDNTTNPSIVVIFNDVQAYPSYLIKFN